MSKIIGNNATILITTKITVAIAINRFSSLTVFFISCLLEQCVFRIFFPHNKVCNHYQCKTN